MLFCSRDTSGNSRALSIDTKLVKKGRCRILSTILSVIILLDETHYENMPIQIYSKNLLQKIENFQIKNADIFLISAQNIDCGYSLEPPRRGGSNEYPQSMFFEQE